MSTWKVMITATYLAEDLSQIFTETINEFTGVVSLLTIKSNACCEAFGSICIDISLNSYSVGYPSLLDNCCGDTRYRIVIL